MKTSKTVKIFCAALLSASMIGCTASAQEENTNTELNIQEITSGESTDTAASNTQDTVTVQTASGTLITDGASLFTDRDNAQTADLSEAVTYTVTDNQDISITEAGVYVIKGTAKEVTITVEAGDEDKVQIVLDGADITNTDAPVIYVKNADKVFVTTTGDNTLKVTGTFTADGDTNTDAVIFSKDDLVLNGTGSLTIESTDNGISSHDDLKITGGTYTITSEADAIEANDSILINNGTFTINSKKDALHAENEDDDSLGYIYISGGTFNITASDDGIQGTSFTQIDGGTFTINAAEGIEATYVQINDGKITISASDDGINASNKSSAYTPVIEINGGDITVKMGSGDTDALDANGSIYINGGTIDITAQFAFDYDGKAELNGGTVTVNGTQVTSITNSMMGGGFGGHGGQMPGGESGDGAWQRPDGNSGMNGEGPQGEMPSDGQMPSGGQMPGGFGGHGHGRP